MGTVSPETFAVAVVFAMAIGLAIPFRRNAPAASQGPGEGKRKGPPSFSAKVLILLAVFLLAFIVCMIVIFCVKGAVPDTLIQYTMGAGGVEAVVLAGIKISKVIKGEKTDE